VTAPQLPRSATREAAFGRGDGPHPASAFGTANPDALELRVYAGADGEFVLAEDRDDERWAETRFTFADGEVRIFPVEGESDAVPAERRYDIVLCGFAAVTGADVGGSVIDASPGPVPGSVVIALPSVAADDGAVLRLRGDLAPAGNTDVHERVFALLDGAQTSISGKDRRTGC
jgi:hypothetical protein